jgi:hypothetical protein
MKFLSLDTAGLWRRNQIGGIRDIWKPISSCFVLDLCVVMIQLTDEPWPFCKNIFDVE